MSSVSVSLEVLAIIVVLLVIAVACCCVAFCVFQMIQQEFRTTERMMVMNAIQNDGMTSIQMVYGPEDYQNTGNVNYGQFNQQRSDQPHQQFQPGTTTTEQTTITTMMTSHPTHPTHPSHRTHVMQPADVYTARDTQPTQRLAAAQRLGFTATHEDVDQSTQLAQPNGSSEKNMDPTNTTKHSIVQNEWKDPNDSNDSNHLKDSQKTFDDSNKNKTQVSSVPNVSSVSDVSDVSNLPKVLLRKHKPKVWKPLKTAEQKLQFFKEQCRPSKWDYNSTEMKEWRFILNKQHSFVNAQRDGWVGWNEQDQSIESIESEQQNDTSLNAKKTN